MSGEQDISAQSCLYFGTVRHARYRPRRHRFTYRVFNIYADIDALEAGALNSTLFKYNRFALFSLRARDHGAKDGSSIRAFVDKLLQQGGIARPDKVMMLCYPRLLGYAFNPITVYYCFTEGRPCAMIYEVRNTFGDDHIYTIACPDGIADIKHSRDKLMHVSPFIGMAATYHFSTATPEQNLRLVIRETEGSDPLLVASFVGQRRALNAGNLISAFVRHPLMTLKVVLAIHFEAAKLFVKGVPFIKRPVPPKSRISF
ncbi:MAG: DUF1365 domain-containing protein [Parvibaculales bacterium]